MGVLSGVRYPCTTGLCLQRAALARMSRSPLSSSLSFSLSLSLSRSLCLLLRRGGGGVDVEKIIATPAQPRAAWLCGREFFNPLRLANHIRLPIFKSISQLWFCRKMAQNSPHVVRRSPQYAFKSTPGWLSLIFFGTMLGFGKQMGQKNRSQTCNVAPSTSGV
jgi:hypothetical protein